MLPFDYLAPKGGKHARLALMEGICCVRSSSRLDRSVQDAGNRMDGVWELSDTDNLQKG